VQNPKQVIILIYSTRYGALSDRRGGGSRRSYDEPQWYGYSVAGGIADDTFVAETNGTEKEPLD